MRKKNLRVVHKQVYDRVPVQQVRPRAPYRFIPETRRMPDRFIRVFAAPRRFPIATARKLGQNA